MGVVYLGRHPELGSRVAIKVLPISSTVSPEELARFRREAALAANLPHPNIVPVYEFEVTTALAYLVMPFIEGVTLAEVLRRRGRLDSAEVRELLRQVGGALSFAHDRGVIHRDIKPSNILRDDATGRWLVTDFGVARAARTAETAITHSGDVVGTPGYMAPEQAFGRPGVDARADIFSLAALACEALTGRRTDTLGDVQEARSVVAAAKLGLSPSAVRALTAPLALDPDVRPDSVKAWLAALDTAPGSRRPLGVWVAAGITLLAAAVGIVVLSRGPPAAPEPSTIAVLPVEVEGAPPAVDLGAALALAMEDQLRWLPNHQIVRAQTISRAAARDGVSFRHPDSLAALAHRRFQAAEVIWSHALLGGNEQIRLDVRRLDPVDGRVMQRADSSGPLDSLSGLVSALLLATVGQRVTEETWGWDAARPRTWDAFLDYYEGDRLFHSGAYDAAVQRYERVIARDSGFALAYFQQMLAELLRVRPTRASYELRSSVDAVGRHRARLDPTSQRLLEGYEVLVREGDLDSAYRAFGEVVERHPNAVDGWFIRGYVEFNLGPLLGRPPAVAQVALRRAYELDPSFAAVVGQLGRLAILQGDNAAARRYIGEYLAIDSTSAWAELARMVDSLLFRGLGAKTRVLGSLNQRPTVALETLALAAGDPGQLSLERAIAELALQVLWERAVSRTDHEVAFRMQLASHLATGRLASVDSLWREARRRAVPQEERDRWLLLTAITGIVSLGDELEQSAAAGRLNVGEPDPVTLWLLSRWWRGRDARRAARAAEQLAALAGPADRGTPLARSLRDDLRALDHLARGDTARALDVWRQAMNRYSVDHTVFGVLGSHWPLRLESARVAAARGLHDGVLATTATFEHLVGFADQVAWPTVLPLRVVAFQAIGDVAAAWRTYETYTRLLRAANGAGAVHRDSVLIAVRPPRISGP